MKLEVGMFVRNNYFGIGKINKDYFDSNNKHWFNVQFNCYKDRDCHCGICEDTNGFKVSHNIIDLIEEGDYVNGEKVIQTYSPEGTYTIWVKLADNAFIDVDHQEDIKSIVTREQFEAMEYKVD